MSNRENQQFVGRMIQDHFQTRSRDPSGSRDPSTGRKEAPPTKPKPMTGSKLRSRGEMYSVQSNGSEKDPIDVYCRIRKLDDQTELVCARVISNNVVRLSNPRNEHGRDSDYTFKHVFCEMASQKDIFDTVAKPLIKDLVHGKNALLFTYGVTGSGKTYTMAGDPSNPGIVPRSLDVLFNSIRDHKQMECTFKPDGANGFTIRSGPEACAARHEMRVTGSGSTPTTPVLGPRTPFGQKKMENMIRREWDNRKKESDYVDLDHKDHGYSVFVTYIEIYENYVYDLLDDSVTQANQPPSKPIRTDKNGSAFVQGLKEIEVSNEDDALKLFLEGNRRRRQASHKMNKESSRSHAIFNVRLVQAVRDPGLEILTDDNNPPIISLLSLVDLAGSENAKKTDAGKKTLKEAGNINNSLDALKRLIKTLRDNQRNGRNTKFDYRTEKLTHLFRTNFEGDGKIRIIICINPAREYYSDTERVLAFASQSQEVMINRALDAFRHKVALFTTDPAFGALQFAPIGGAAFGPPLPSSNFLDPNDEKAIPEWIEALEARKQSREEGLFKLNDTFGFFRSKLAKTESGNLLIEQQLKQKETELKAREMQAIQAEQEVNLQRSEMESYRRKVASLEKLVQERDGKIHSLQLTLREKDEERERLKVKYQEHVRSEQKRIKAHYERQLIEVVSKFQNENLDYKERMRLLNEIITSDPNSFVMVRENYLASRSTNSPPPIHLNGVSSSSGSSALKQGPSTPTSPSKKKRNNRQIPASDDILERSRRSRHRSSPVLPMDTETNGLIREEQHPPSFNPRHKRSLSAGNGNWIDHRPPGTLDLGTIFQPKIKNKTSLSNLKDASAKTFKRASNYALTHHVADPVNGEVETQVIKGDVIPSLGGGAHVIFNDVETLKQSDPCSPSATHRKRSLNDGNDVHAIAPDTPTTSISTSNKSHPNSPMVSKRSRR